MTMEMKFSHSRGETHFDIDMMSKVRAGILFNLFYKIFDVVHADTPALKEEAHRVRYQVFCLENEGFEDPAAHPDGLEKDVYDSHAEHALLIHKPSGKAIGTMRVIFPKEEDWQNSFPLQNLCSSTYLHDESYVRNACELSRMCVSEKARLQMKEEARGMTHLLGKDNGYNLTIYEKPLLQTVLAMAPLGLVRGAMEVAMKRGIFNVFGVMEPRHVVRLQNAGIVLEQIGPEMDFHGTRIPFISNFLDSYENTISSKHEVWSILTMKGINHQRALEIYENQFQAKSQSEAARVSA